MAISDTITSMYENVGNVYDVLELAGADLTNVDKNIENLKQSWEERLLYFLANGTDVVWNNWLPKVTGSGTEITLNNTIEAKMDFVYKGNTSQEITEGYNLLDFSGVSQESKVTVNDDGTVTLNGAGNFSLNFKEIEVTQGTTYSTFVELVSGTITGNPVNGTGLMSPLGKGNFLSNNTQDIYTPNSNVNRHTIWVGDQGTYNNAKFRIWAYVGSTVKPFEPYTGNQPSPSPDYPQEIQVVSGDNTIKVEGKNIYTGEIEYNNSVLASNGTINSATGFIISKPISIDISKDIYVSFVAGSLTDKAMRVGYYDGNDNFISRPNFETTPTKLTPPSNAQYLRLSYDSRNFSNVQVEYNQATTYEPYQSASYPINLGNIELCKIGTYQDKIAKSTGKNLFDYKTPNINQITWTPTDNGGKFTSSTHWKNLGNKLELDTTKQYTFSFGARNSDKLYYYIKTYTDETYQTVKTTIVNDGTALSKTFTPDSKYVSIYFANGAVFNNVEIPNIQLEESSTKTEFEPYLPKGTWYLNKQIGKVVLNGSENWNYGASGATGIISSSIQISSMLSGNYLDGLATYFHNDKSGKANNSIRFGANSKYIYLYLDETEYTSANDVKNWLGTHNTTVYYVLATPTTTEITDTTLISQLEAIKKSYNTQTSISQVNNDLPFILDVTALGN